MMNSPLGGPGSNRPPRRGSTASVLLPPGGETTEVTRSPWSVGFSAAVVPAPESAGSLFFFRFRRPRPASRAKPLKTSAKVPSSPRPGASPASREGWSPAPGASPWNPDPVLIETSSHRFADQRPTRTLELRTKFGSENLANPIHQHGH